ncbi:MAG: thioredoxin [Candidatus Cryptobacteroides sp.]
MEVTISNQNLAEVLASSSVVLVDFWATWCGPCRMLAPVVEEVAAEFEGKVVVAKCNVDEAREVAMQFRVMSIPTLIYFKNGEVADKTVGVVPKEDIVSKLNNLL